MNPWLKKVFDLYIFAFAFFLASRPLSDGDFWFHLKTGEYIIQNGFVPTADPWSFTHLGRPWVAHGWLSGLIFYVIYSNVGQNLLILISAFLTVLSFWIAVRKVQSHPIISGTVGLLGVLSVITTIGVRPRTFTLLLASGYLALLSLYVRTGKTRWIWSLIPLMILWVNLHGGFLVGLALIGLTTIGIPLDAWALGESYKSWWPRFRLLLGLLLVCSLVALVNPFGLNIYSDIIETLRSPVYQTVVRDWFSPNFHETGLQPLLLLILLTIAAMVLSPKKTRPSELLLFLATLYATLKTQRNLAILALVAVPILAQNLQDLLEVTSFGKSTTRESKSPLSAGTILLIGILFLPLFVFYSELRSKVYSPQRQEVLKVPVGAVNFLKQNQITGNTFTEPNIWGGYLIWDLPSNPVYIDGRGVFPEEFIREYVNFTRGSTDWRPAFERYNVQNVIVATNSLLARELRKAPEWQQVFEDEMAVVFIRK